MRPVFLIIATLVSYCLGLPTKHSNLKIYGGQTAEPGQFPFVVAINETYFGLTYCTGSIIHENWVLTTATCSENFPFKANDLVVISGTTRLDTDTGVVYNVSQIVVHPNYSKGNLTELARGNIALFQIDGSFEFSNLVQPIELGDEVSVNDSVVVVGFGGVRGDNNPPLQYAEVTAWSNEDCKTSTGFNNLGPEDVCAFGGEGVGICEGTGDRGAPLVLDGTLVGFGARAVWDCATGYPDIYTRVSYYKDWINDVIKS